MAANVYTNLVGSFWVNLPFFIILITGLIIFAIDKIIKAEDKSILIYLALFGVFGALFLFWRSYVVNVGGVFLGFEYQRFSINLVVILLLFSALYLISIRSFFEGLSIGSFLPMFMFLLFALCTALAVSNLFVIFIAQVIISISITQILKLNSINLKQSSLKKIWFYFVIVDLLFCFGSVFYYGSTGTFDIGSSQQISLFINKLELGNFFRIGMSVIGCSLLAKIAIIPFHWWMADINETQEVVWLSLTGIFYRVAASLICLKIFLPLLPILNSFLEKPIYIIGLISLTVANMMAIRARNFLAVINYLSIAYISIFVAFLPCVAIDSEQGIVACITMLFVYFLSFTGIYSILMSLNSGEKRSFEYENLNGLGHKRPGLAVCLSFFFLIIIGLPFTLGFLDKILILRNIILVGNYSVAIIIGVNLAIMIYYCLSLIIKFYLFKPDHEFAYEGEQSSSLTLAILFCLLTLIYTGISPNSLVSWIKLVTNYQ